MIGVSEDSLVEGMKFMLEHHQQIVEPSGIAAVSAILSKSESLKGKNVAAIVTGRNISYSQLNQLISAKQ